MHLLNIRKGFNSITETLKIKSAGQICSKEEFVKIIENERARADRNNHYFSLILFDIASIGIEKVAIERLIESISRRIRKIDNVGWYDNQHIGVILPYTSDHGARKFAALICYALEVSDATSICNIYTYPSDQTSL